MPGRSCVALVLLINSGGRKTAEGSLVEWRTFRKFQTAARRSDAWNDSRRAGKKNKPSTNAQYKRGQRKWSNSRVVPLQNRQDTEAVKAWARKHVVWRRRP